MYLAPNKTYSEFRCTHCDWSLTMSRLLSVQNAPAYVSQQFENHSCSDKPKRHRTSAHEVSENGKKAIFSSPATRLSKTETVLFRLLREPVHGVRSRPEHPVVFFPERD